MATVTILGHEVEVELDDRSIMRGVLEMVKDIQAAADDEGRMKIDPAGMTLEVIDIIDRADAKLIEVVGEEGVSRIYGGKKRPIFEPIAAMMELGNLMGQAYDKAFEKYLPEDVREATE